MLRIQLCLVLLFLAAPGFAQTYSVERGVVSSNGGTVSGGPFRLHFSIGQVAASSSSASSTRLNSGFWWEVTSPPSVGTESEPLPANLAFSPTNPNPFSNQTVIRYAIPSGPEVRVFVGVYDVRGALVKTLVNDTRAPGQYTLTWNGSSDDGGRLSAGVYFVRFHVPSFSQQRRVVMLR